MKFNNVVFLLLVLYSAVSMARVALLPFDLLKEEQLNNNAVDIKLPAIEKLQKIFETKLQINENDVDADLVPELPAVVADDAKLQPSVKLNDVVTMSKNSACNIQVRSGITNPQPVFLKPNTNEFFPYSETGVMEFNVGSSIEMWCSSSFTKFSTKLITASCVLGSTFTVDGVTHDFKDFSCKTWPDFTAEKTGATCNGGILIRSGFRISSSRFIEQMQICFNEDEEVTRYVRHTLNPGSHFYQTSVERLNFQTAGFFNGKNVDKLYTQNVQTETLNKELGGNANNYLNPSKNIYLARGHMAAKADFVYGAQQRATFLFVDVAPQWQVFNAGNWARMEDGFRAWISTKRMHVNCYTGVWSVTTLPNINGVEVPLYLYYDQNHNGLIPVPKIFFRVAIEPATQRGIVFIGVNNPHLTLEQIKKDYIICKDVSDQITYINWRKTDIVAGYSYACEVSDFLKTVKHLPALTANGGLLV